MDPVVGVHGIWNHKYLAQAKGDLLAATGAIGTDWTGWLAKGLGGRDLSIPAPAEVPVAYYADCLYRGTRMGADPALLEPFAQELYVAWVEELRRELLGAATEPLVRQGRLTRRLLRQPADWLTENFGVTARRVVFAVASELATYFAPEFGDRRAEARGRVLEAVLEYRPRVLLAHSLGSVVAYEALCSDPDARVELLVTLGSPLGMTNVVFERLLPEPIGRGLRPAGIRRWVNIADRGDPVAIPCGRLKERFDGIDEDLETSIHLVDPHLVKNYLRCPEVADALAPYLFA